MTKKTTDPGAERVGQPDPKPAKTASHLVSMHKGDETIAVHPDAVAEHERLGWAREA